jgi:acetyl esterase/lipase
VAAWLETVDAEMGGLSELVIVGFSSGGVIASHVMQRLKHRTFRKKIVTYDTPWQVQDNVESFAQNLCYRPDVIFYQMVHHTYSTHFDRDALQECLHAHDHRWCKGAHELVDVIKRAHRYTDAEMHAATGWNFDQTPDTVVFNIHTTHDPFVDRAVHDRFVHANRDKITFQVVTLSKPIWGHTCDMAFSTDYLQELTFAICF